MKKLWVKLAALMRASTETAPVFPSNMDYKQACTVVPELKLRREAGRKETLLNRPSWLLHNA